MQLFNFLKNPDRFSFLSKATESQRVRYGTFMWICLFFGYFIFCFNWILMGKLSGGSSSGWVKDLNVSSNKIMIESSMYMVSFARGVATLGVAWLMTKLSHKWATLIALFLNTISLPLIFFPYFSLFVIGRMFMACGGTMLIILIYPVLTRFFNLEQKGKLTTYTSLAYLLGGLAVNLLFIYSGGSGGWEEKLQQNWKLVAGIFAGFSYLPLLAYPFVGKDFLTSDNMQQDIDQLELPKNTYKGIIKEKNMWLWIFLYSFLLVASLIVSLEVPKIITGDTGVGKHLKFGDNVKWSSVYSICFFVGCICGLCLGILNKKQYRRKPVVVLSFSLALLFLGIIVGVSHWTNVAGASSIIFISVFFFAFFAMGIQPVILYIPHEYEENDNAKRITIFYSYLWGFGYVIFTVYQIIVAALRNGSRLRYDYMNFGFILMLIAGAIVCSLLIKESRPEYKLHPWQK